jgi:hypothetical protein
VSAEGGERERWRESERESEGVRKERELFRKRKSNSLEISMHIYYNKVKQIFKLFISI